MCMRPGRGRVRDTSDAVAVHKRWAVVHVSLPVTLVATRDTLACLLRRSALLLTNILPPGWSNLARLLQSIGHSAYRTRSDDRG
ncbi:hypothetical protein RSAG8_05768, partial [Rhizoctonia solani AG-8 WAC10335]